MYTHNAYVILSLSLYPSRDQISFSSILSEQNAISMQTPDQRRKLSSPTGSRARTSRSYNELQNKEMEGYVLIISFFFKAEMTRIAMSQDKEVGVERGSMVGQVTKRILCLGTFFCQ